MVLSKKVSCVLVIGDIDGWFLHPCSRRCDRFVGLQEGVNEFHHVGAMLWAN